jgi:SNF2 family DNA or RNA helicase
VTSFVQSWREYRSLVRRHRAASERVKQAKSLIADARQQAFDARSEFEFERGENALPDVENPTDLDLNYISALDHFHHTHTSLNIPFQEMRETWESSLRARQELRKFSTLARTVVQKSARVFFYEQMNLLDVSLNSITAILKSRLTDTTLQRIAQRAQKRDPQEALRKYRQNNAEFIATLDRLNFYVLGDQGDNRRGLHGGIPGEIAERIESTPLLHGPLTAILRRYQEFGARYLIVQKRTLLGDDMGLGKTVQVLAAMSHLHALGARHFLVIAPNSVLVNWERETRKHSLLEPFLAHGPDREDNVETWLTRGGVAITTYGTISKIADLIPDIDMIAVDEAHYVKNPNAQRTLAVQGLTQRSEYVTLMTGTALENRLEEMQFLVTLAQPDIAPILEDLINQGVRAPEPDDVVRELSPVYLRRTQKDVLHELPERIVTDEWIELHDEDYEYYRNVQPDVMAKRIAAITGSGQILPAKYERLLELAEEHFSERRKIVVFSYFRKVIDDVCALFPDAQQITGSTSSTQRQHILDSFSSSPDEKVLVAQIDAGGTGINLQSAQVVILMEPQMKPSTEWQAIARVHRMGQTRTVLVHRLLARHTIDERMVELIEMKTGIFHSYAHDSAVRDASLMAIDSRSGDIESELRQWLEES